MTNSVYCDIDEHRLVCRKCGRDASHNALLRKCPKKPLGLGDMVAAGLSAVGVTKQLVSAVIGRPCACPERQAALNQIGHKYLGLPTGTRG